MLTKRDCVAFAIAFVLVIACILSGYNPASRDVDTSSRYVECGMCGAHVLEWWYITGSDGEPVEVCEYCYLESRDM